MGHVGSGLVNKVVSLEKIKAHDQNYNFHPEEQLVQLAASYKTLGQFRSVVLWQQEDGSYIQLAGHGVVEAMKHEGAKEVRADCLPPSLGPMAAKQIMLADNLHAQQSSPDMTLLASLLKEQKDEGYSLEALGSSEHLLQHLIDTLADEALGLNDHIDKPDKTKKVNPRNLPFDMIYTWGNADATCCMAVQAGLKYGIQSGDTKICPHVDDWGGKHKVCFLDNDYFHYDHALHLSMVKKYRPKYATTMDVMTKAQCAKDGIKWIPLEQILEWAKEVNEYAENVIIIPKYDCLAQIPDNYVLGYSVPSSHGGTPLPIEVFKGRRVHLLGGSWKMQLSYMAVLGDDVVSADNNEINKTAMYANFIDPNGEETKLREIGFDYLTNPRYVALAFTFGAIGAKINELYGAPPAEEVEAQ